MYLNHSVEVTRLAGEHPQLFWESTYAIAMALIDQHPDVNPQQVGMVELAALVQSLPGFQDDPASVTTQTLLDIHNVWYEEMTTL